MGRGEPVRFSRKLFPLKLISKAKTRSRARKRASAGTARPKNHVIWLEKKKKRLGNLSLLTYEMSQPYKKLFTFWFSVLIYDRTVEFRQKWIKSWKLKEQMEGAARSGKQNIVEGSDNLTTSLKVCIKLTGIAKSSIEELIGDLEDFLRQRGLAQWEKDDPRVRALRARSATLVRNLSHLRNLRELEKLPLPQVQEDAANFLLTLCYQATYLLNRQVESLKTKHEKEGGLTEELYRKRKEFRGF